MGRDGGLWNIKEQEQNRPDDIEGHHGQIGSHEGDRAKGHGRIIAKLRADDRREQAARHDIGDCFGAKRV